jgi:hypothetical protein
MMKTQDFLSFIKEIDAEIAKAVGVDLKSPTRILPKGQYFPRYPDKKLWEQIDPRRE